MPTQRLRSERIEHAENHQQDHRRNPRGVEEVREISMVEREEQVLPGGERHAPTSNSGVVGGRRMPCQAVYSALALGRRRNGGGDGCPTKRAARRTGGCPGCEPCCQWRTGK